MTSRTVALTGTLVFLVLLGVPTLYVLSDSGLSILLVISVVILAIVIVGVLGALWSPPEE